MHMIKKIMDGNEAAAYVSYAFTEVAAIYPITPSSPMAQVVDKWAAAGKKNIFGQTVKLIEMQSEAGAIAVLHGALEAGTLATSYTSSQGLVLMIPTMSRIAGQLKPGVLHVASRTVATHAYSIFAEHSDVMACRQTGFAMLASSNVQQTMDLGAVAHLAAIKGRIPFMHFFDGFRTSHEIQKIDCLNYAELGKLVDFDALRNFRRNALNPEHPVLRSAGQNPDIFFQAREACNPYYEKLPSIVEAYMDSISELTGKRYRLFDYYGVRDAEYIIVSMGSVSGTIQETVEYLNRKGKKVGFIDVHLYRPFSAEHFLKILPPTVKRIMVLDRTKEPGAAGEPLYEDVCLVVSVAGIAAGVIGGRYGLGGKDTSPVHIASVFENGMCNTPKNHFTIGIEDDVTNYSLSIRHDFEIESDGTVQCKFWGFGSDGTVSGNKNSIKIIGDNTDLYIQAYFEYDGKKSGGVTKSHLRFGKNSIRSSYYIRNADFVACHNQTYITTYDMISDLKPEGSFLLNCSWKPSELEEKLPANFKRYVAKNNVRFYMIDASGIANQIGLGNRTNTILQAAFFKIIGILPIEKVLKSMKKLIQDSYGSQGEKVVEMNYLAAERGAAEIIEFKIPPEWGTVPPELLVEVDVSLPCFIQNQLLPILSQRGDTLPVSVFQEMPDGTVPLGISKYDKRGIAFEVPVWIKEHCIQCNQCAFVCPHSAIRPFLLTEEEGRVAPETFETVAATGKKLIGFQFRIQVDTLDCTGCGSCAHVCPAQQKALKMRPLEEQKNQIANWEYAMSIGERQNPIGSDSVKGSQFNQPLLEFPGACPGCGQTPHVKLITQLFGDRMYIANATGCSLVWATDYPLVPYTVNKNGHGPAYSNSLFENNGEFGMGIALGVEQLRGKLKDTVNRLIQITGDVSLKQAAQTWVTHYSDGAQTKAASAALRKMASESTSVGEERELITVINENAEHLVKKSIWMIGGDGWAYDIGFGGLDHVLATADDVNIFVLDTEVYSNTGGQASKATPRGAVAQFAASGMKYRKKNLALMAMSYGNVYVAQVSMGASQSQFLKALIEAEAYPGPSLIIAYTPCIMHGLHKGMNSVQSEMKQAVQTGYWHLFRYNPLLAEEGKNPFILDSPKPDGDFLEFLRGEVRYSSLELTFPEQAKVLFQKATQDAEQKYEMYRRMADGQGDGMGLWSVADR